MEKIIHYKPIGTILTPFTQTKGMPIQSSFSKERGTVILKKQFLEGVKGLKEFSHIILLYHFHHAKKEQLLVKPFLSEQELGIFAIRAPNRPNSIGISVVRLIEIINKKKSVELIVEGVDMLDQTPLLDIKPYIKEFDSFPKAICGWYDKREIKETNADDRFSKV